jgi:hypothetical protein
MFQVGSQNYIAIGNYSCHQGCAYGEAISPDRIHFLAAEIPRDLSDYAKFALGCNEPGPQFFPEGSPGGMAVGTAQRLFFRI